MHRTRGELDTGKAIMQPVQKIGKPCDGTEGKRNQDCKPPIVQTIIVILDRVPHFYPFPATVQERGKSLGEQPQRCRGVPLSLAQVDRWRLTLRATPAVVVRA